ncbi:spore protease YyaC [Paenibacillus sp. YPG26]|uniref:spore protease YyaC n=1 Tax=Paenibacillus sp. YPG26 TaxID=2878915 RepID=UPI00203F2C08|nr:spore protease YyaC [Paenibacillus sp. YPG26]USB32610.1 spore protease YyaC [Paenibacillus sp. YPG26]
MRASRHRVLDQALARRKWSAGSELTEFFKEVWEQNQEEKITFLCIGTDRSSGDALGPLTGSRLIQYGFTHVIGTLERPCDSSNFNDCLKAIPTDHQVVAIDACLGTSSSVGHYILARQPLLPAQSVGGNLPPVGDYSVAAIVNVKGPKPYSSLQMASLYQVMGMAEEIAGAVALAFGRITESASKHGSELAVLD